MALYCKQSYTFCSVVSFPPALRLAAINLIDVLIPRLLLGVQQAAPLAGEVTRSLQHHPLRGALEPPLSLRLELPPPASARRAVSIITATIATFYYIANPDMDALLRATYRKLHLNIMHLDLRLQSRTRTFVRKYLFLK